MRYPARLLRAAFWLLLLGVYIVSIWPRGLFTLGSSDKVNHAAAFFTLALMARLAYPRLWWIVTFVMLALFGAAIEFTQMIPALHRDADWYDWFADVGAIIAGLLLSTLALRVLGHSGERVEPAE